MDDPGNSQEYKNPKEELSTEDNEETLTSEKACQTEGPWDTIIVNQIPTNVDYEKLISVFSRYGNIESTYLCKRKDPWKNMKHERVAKITFSDEDDARKVWEASQEKLIKYDDHVLTITLVSTDYSPIQNLPDTCLREIFQRVNSFKDKLNVEMVCRRWRDHGRCCWSNVRGISTFRGRIDVWKTIFSRVGNSLEDLYFSGWDAKDAEIYAVAAEHCVRLKSLKCEFRLMPYELCILPLYTMLQKNENLRRFHLRPYSDGNLKMNFMDFLPVGLYEIDIRAGHNAAILSTMVLSRLQNLRVLIFFGVVITHPEAFDNLMNLEHLGLIYCEVTQASVSTILRNNKGLKYLDIAAEDLSDAALNCILQLPNLEVLVMESEKFTDEHLRYMRSLRALSCSKCPRVTNQGIQNYLNRASDIKHLCILNYSITVECIGIARKWTERTGKSLKLLVDENLYTENDNSEWQDDGKFQVQWVTEDGVHGMQDDDWFYELVESES